MRPGIGAVDIMKLKNAGLYTVAVCFALEHVLQDDFIGLLMRLSLFITPPRRISRRSKASVRPRSRKSRRLLRNAWYVHHASPCNVDAKLTRL
jgi:hypothetical protein